MGNKLHIDFKKKDEKTVVFENPNKYIPPKVIIEEPILESDEIKKLRLDLKKLKNLRKREHLIYRNEFNKSEERILDILGPQKIDKDICDVQKKLIIDCLENNPEESLNCQQNILRYIECVRNKSL